MGPYNFSLNEEAAWAVSVTVFCLCLALTGVVASTKGVC